MPLVSVIIPFYKGADWLREAIESVFSQTYVDYEIIVVNDGSDEDISLLLEQYGNRIKYVYQQNAGPGKARNTGLSLAEGEYIALLDSDDLWLPEKLEEQISFMEANPQIMWSHTCYETFGFGDDKIVDTSYFNGVVYPACFVSCPVATPCVVIRKEVFDENDYLRFSETMRFGQDFYLWVLLAQRYEPGVINKVLSKVRMRGGNAAKRAYVMLKSKKEIINNLKKTGFIDVNQLPLSIRFPYKWCSIGFDVITCLEKVIKNKKVIEFISKVIYICPYVLLKILK